MVNLTAGDLTAEHPCRLMRIEADKPLTGRLRTVCHDDEGKTSMAMDYGRGHGSFPHATPVALLDADDRAPLDGQEALL